MTRLRIGLLGGISAKSTIKYYELLLNKYYEREKNYYYPEIVIFSLDFQKVTDLEDSGDLEGYISYLMEGIKALERANADFILITANSPHSVYYKLQDDSDIPILSILDATAREAIRRKLKKLLLLGIKFTMRSKFYHSHFKKKGIEILTPNFEDQDILNNIIFNELVLGIIRERSKQTILRIISKFEVDGVILGCTELPLIINENKSELEILDTVKLHVDYALEKYFSVNQSA